MKHGFLSSGGRGVKQKKGGDDNNDSGNVIEIGNHSSVNGGALNSQLEQISNDSGDETNTQIAANVTVSPTGLISSRLTSIETANCRGFTGDALLHYDAEIKLMNMILLSIPNEIYNSVDTCTLVKDMWKRVERPMRGTIQNKVDRESRFTNEFAQFIAEPGEALVFVYNRFAQLMNDFVTPQKMSSHARALIELRADVELKDTIVVATPKLVGEGFYTCTICVEYEWKPLSTSTTPIVEKIDKLEKLIVDRKFILMDDEDKPLENVDSSGDHDSKDEVEPDDNEMTS
nr:hypothetical protein [Tanacetum cinerariifolium]